MYTYIYRYRCIYIDIHTHTYTNTLTNTYILLAICGKSLRGSAHLGNSGIFDLYLWLRSLHCLPVAM